SRACRLANAFGGIGLNKGDRVCVLAYNCVEWLEIYAAAALAGVVAVPINFRLTGPEARYIIENCNARALIVQDELVEIVECVQPDFALRMRTSSTSAVAFAPRVIVPMKIYWRKRAIAGRQYPSRAMMPGR